MATVDWTPERLQSIKIANGGTVSDVLDMRIGKRATTNILIQGPATALTGTVTVQVSATGPNGPWSTLQSAGTDVEINTAAGGVGKATMLDPLTAGAMRLVSSTPETGGDKVFVIRGDTRE